ncbi:MAG: DUF58 domain-containing protein [Microbacterium sp.]|uniref:DUF58 domain-containing protein n=1 Tax=Microbacterium sp. TaxID=51671 RepID=UPI003A8C7715
MNRIWPLTLRGTGALLLAVACFVFAGQLGVSELVYFALLLLAVLATSLASLYLVRRADAVRRTIGTDVAAVGRTSIVSVQVNVRTALPMPPGRWEDSLPHTLSGEASGVFPALASGLRADDRTVRLSYPITGVHRGVRPIGPLRITSTDPFGLARRRHVLRARTSVTVVPPVVDLPPISNLSGATGGILQATAEQPGQGADNLIARPHVPGDSMRRIHWRATAHRDELMVRQEEQEAAPDATVVLDRSLLRYASEALRAPGADPGFETAVTMCVSAATRLMRDGYVVEVIDTDGVPLTDPLGGDDVGEVDAMLTVFASITATRDDHLGGLPAQFTGATMGPLVLIVGRFDAADAALLAPVAHRSSLPALFAVAPVGDALDAAAAAGWRCATIDPEADLATAWHAVSDRGVSHVYG